MEEETNYLLRLNKSDLDSAENWVSLGYDYHNRQDDAAMHRLLGFLTVFQLVALTFIWNYNTDFK